MERHSKINNDFYDELGIDWYSGENHPIALLRAENSVRIPWIAKNLPPASILLDIGCGGGLLTNALAKLGHTVTGIDISEKSLEVARAQDKTATVRYLTANAYSLPFPDNSFDAISAMDLLEHVESPHLVIAEAARVLKPKGLFFFHTFNRNLLSYLLIIKGVDWFVPNAPKNMHVYPLFIKPKELEEMCETYRLRISALHGFRPVFSPSLFKMALRKQIPADLSFRFCRSLKTGYCGYARKRGSLSLL